MSHFALLLCEAREGGIYLGRSIVNAIGRGRILQSLRRKFLVTKRAFSLLAPSPSLGLSRMGDLGLQDPPWLITQDKDVGVPLRLTEC